MVPKTTRVWMPELGVEKSDAYLGWCLAPVGLTIVRRSSCRACQGRWQYEGQSGHSWKVWKIISDSRTPPALMAVDARIKIHQLQNVTMSILKAKYSNLRL